MELVLWNWETKNCIFYILYFKILFCLRLEQALEIFMDAMQFMQLELRIMMNAINRSTRKQRYRFRKTVD